MDKSKGLALVLTFFTGFVGIHHFYLGNKTRGFVYLFFFWTLLPAIASVADFLILFSLDQDEFHQMYDLGTLPKIPTENNVLHLHPHKGKAHEEYDTDQDINRAA